MALVVPMLVGKAHSFSLPHAGQFHARANPSAGAVAYLQSMVCNVQNWCRPMGAYEEIPSYNGSL